MFLVDIFAPKSYAQAAQEAIQRLQAQLGQGSGEDGRPDAGG